MRRLGRKLRNFLFPTAANAYHPGIFKKDAVIAIAAVLLFLQLGYAAFVTVVLHRTNFLAAVLPGVLTALTNADRAQNNVNALTENPLLDRAAQESVDDMAAKGYFSHTTPDGKSPWYWLDQVGYEYSYAGQNLAVNFTDSADVENAWMNSPTHRANIVKPQFTQVGIAVATGTYKGKSATFVVQFFGTPASHAAAAQEPTTSRGSGSVLGAETGPVEVSADLSPIAAVAASPNQAILFVSAGVLGILALLLVLAIFVKVRVQYLSVIVGGLILLGAAGASFFVSETRVSNSAVELPTDTNSAVVYTGFSG